MIQISQSTENYLIDAGHSGWFKPRDDEVQAKGKEELQTYWLFIDDRNETGEDMMIKKVIFC
jgi:hypothetical protein